MKISDLQGPINTVSAPTSGSFSIDQRKPMSSFDLATTALGSSQSAMEKLQKPDPLASVHPGGSSPIDWGNTEQTKNIPGGVIGNAIGTLWAQHAPTWLGGAGSAANQVTPGPTGEQVAGDVLRSAAIPAALAVAPATAVGAAVAGAELGAAQAGGQAMVDKGTPDQVVQSATEGAALGGVTGGVGGALGSALQKLPSRLVASALPKLNPNNYDKVLTDTKLGTVKSMFKEAQSNANELHGYIVKELEKPEFANAHLPTTNPFEATVAAFPQSEYTSADILGAVKEVAPGFSRLTSKVASGDATLAEYNDLRQAIDANTKKIFTDSPQVSNIKTLAAQFASTLRGEVQNTAKATGPIFEEWSKELDIMKALQTASKKLKGTDPVNLKSLLSFSVAGLPGAMLEEASRLPGVKLALAKGANVAGGPIRTASPVLANVASRVVGETQNGNE